MEKTSWGKSSRWYNRIVGQKGHYYHQHTVMPAVLKLLDLNSTSKVIDFGCGQGVLARNINQEVEYLGVDISGSLIRQAETLDHNPKHSYVVGDVTKSLNHKQAYFSHATFILSLQNVRDQDAAIGQAAAMLTSRGKLILVLNHPCFRIPRQSGWDIDATNKVQKRCISKYMSRMEIPIATHPSARDSSLTWSFHWPLTDYVKSLVKHGFVLDGMEELVSDKESVGQAAKMENRGRAEIPLFLVILAVKQIRN